MRAEKIRANTDIKATDSEGIAEVVVVVATIGTDAAVIVITDKVESLTAAVVMSLWTAETNVGSRMSSISVFISVASVAVIWTRISPSCKCRRDPATKLSEICDSATLKKVANTVVKLASMVAKFSEVTPATVNVVSTTIGVPSTKSGVVIVGHFVGLDEGEWLVHKFVQ